MKNLFIILFLFLNNFFVYATSVTVSKERLKENQFSLSSSRYTQAKNLAPNSDSYDSCRKCHMSHRGILKHISDPENLSQGCTVQAILHCDRLTFFHGQAHVATYIVSALSTPLLFTPGSDLCFFLKTSGEVDSQIFCAHNMNCRNEWWKAITRAVLCSHHGISQRHEIAGDPSIEEEEELIEEQVVQDPKKGGINIRLSDIPERPRVKLIHQIMSAI